MNGNPSSGGVVRTVAVPLDRIDTRPQGARAPWFILRDACAASIGVDPRSVSVEDVALSPSDYLRLRDHTKLWAMLRGLSADPDAHPAGRCIRNQPSGYAYLVLAGRP
jgi:hypothetical protein